MTALQRRRTLISFEKVMTYVQISIIIIIKDI